MSVIDQGVVVFARGTLPGQDNFIAIAVLTEDEGCIGVDGSGVSDACGVVGVALVQLAVDIGGIAIDLSQTGFGDIDVHVTVIAGIGDGELTITLHPGCDFVSAILISEELDLNILQGLVIGQAFADGVIEVIGSQAGCIGSDGGQSGNDLILQNIASGCGSIMLEAIGDGIGTIVGAGILLSLTDGLFQSGDASLVLGVHDYIVVPEVATLRRSRVSITRDGGHGQGHEEGIGGRSNHFRHDIFHNQVQTNAQVALDGLTVVIGQSHIDSVGVRCHECFQSVLDSGGVLSKRSSHSLVQDVRLIEPAVAVQVISIHIAILTVAQTDCSQQILGFDLIEGIQNLGQVVIGMLIICGFSEGGNGCNIGDGEANALNGITVTGLAIAKGMVGRVVAIALADTAAQDIFHIGLSPAGGHEGILAPDTILDGIGPVILPDGQGAVSFFIDGGIFHLSCKGSRNTGQHHHQAQANRHELLKIFHNITSFLS